MDSSSAFSSVLLRYFKCDSFYLKRKQELSEYKAIYMIKDYFPLLFQAIAVGTEELLKNSASPLSAAQKWS